MLEALEQRQLFASFAPTLTSYSVSVSLSAQGTLNIVGNDASNDITVNLVSGKVEVVAKNAVKQYTQNNPIPTYSNLVRKFNASEVYDMYVLLNGGNDKFQQQTPCVSEAIIWAGSGNDTIKGHFGSADGQAEIFGQAGNDVFETAGIACFVDGGTGADTFGNHGNSTGPMVDYSGRATDLVVDMNFAGGDGEAGENDTVHPSCFGIVGGSGDDLLIGASSVAGTFTSGEGMFWANDGNDTVFGGVGYDVINGGAGDDELHSGPVGDGPDIGGALFGEDGNDTLYGTGNDGEILDGGAGEDEIFPDE